MLKILGIRACFLGNKGSWNNDLTMPARPFIREPDTDKLPERHKLNIARRQFAFPGNWGYNYTS